MKNFPSLFIFTQHKLLRDWKILVWRKLKAFCAHLQKKFTTLFHLHCKSLTRTSFNPQIQSTQPYSFNDCRLITLLLLAGRKKLTLFNVRRFPMSFFKQHVVFWYDPSNYSIRNLFSWLISCRVCIFRDGLCFL